MTTKGLIGFRCNDTDKLIYNHSDSHPDTLGLKVLRDFREVSDWNTVCDRVESLVSIPETRMLGDNTSMAESEIRRHFPEQEHQFSPRNFYDLYQPLQGTLKSYLDGRLSFMPDASDFIRDSRHCQWAYIANLDTERFEVWKGNQLEPDHEDNRLVEEENRYSREMNRMGYYPCAMVRSYDLSDLPNPGLFLTYYSFSGDLNGPR